MIKFDTERTFKVASYNGFCLEIIFDGMYPEGHEPMFNGQVILRTDNMEKEKIIAETALGCYLSEFYYMFEYFRNCFKCLEENPDYQSIMFTTMNETFHFQVGYGDDKNFQLTILCQVGRTKDNKYPLIIGAYGKFGVQGFNKFLDDIENFLLAGERQGVLPEPIAFKKQLLTRKKKP